MIKDKAFTMPLSFWEKKNQANKMILDSATATFREELHFGEVLKLELYDENNKLVTLFLRRSVKTL